MHQAGLAGRGAAAGRKGKAASLLFLPRPPSVSMAGKGRAQLAQGCVFLPPGPRPACVRAAGRSPALCHAALQPSTMPAPSLSHRVLGSALPGVQLLVGCGEGREKQLDLTKETKGRLGPLLSLCYGQPNGEDPFCPCP